MSTNVSAWLNGLGLGQYTVAFEKNAIDWDLLPDLDQQTLKDIGVDAAGDRLRILKAIDSLHPVLPDAAVESRKGSQRSNTTSQTVDEDASAWSRTPGERKPVTMLFADIVGSTTLTEKLDAEDAHDLLYRATQCMCRAVENNTGTVCRFMGDGIMAMFGAPVASERHALEACRAALDMQTSIGKYARELEDSHGSILQVRVGLHSGEVVVLEVGDDPLKPEYDASGSTVPLAARMEQSARAGTIQITQETRALAGDSIVSCEQPRVTVKGISEPVVVYQLQKVLSAAESSTIAARQPIVGRKSELAQFRGLLEACLESGHGQTVIVRGEAGIGKTRLVEEMAALARKRGFSNYRALVLDFGAGKGQAAIPSLVRRLLGITQDSNKRERELALDQAEKNGIVDHGKRIFLNDLLDLTQPLELRTLYDAMDVQTRKGGKRAALGEMVTRLAARQPVVIIIEDLHWADSITLDYLARLASTVAECPVLLVFTSRAEGDPLDTTWRASAGESPIVTWDLSPLRKEESFLLVSAFIDASDSLAERCIVRAAGNPLFLEQLLLSVKKGDAESVPGSIKSLVLSRMDQLPPDDKHALQAAAVLGQRFDIEGLRFLLEMPAYACQTLVERHLLRPEGALYLFAHALIQEGAYASLVKSQRNNLHRQAAAWYQNRDPALYAEHLDSAGDIAAPDAYLAAAREQHKLFRPEGALQLVRRGLAIAPQEKRFELLCLEGELLRFVGCAAESIESYQQAGEFAKGEIDRCRALVGIAEGLEIIENHEQLLKLLDEAEALADAHELWLELAIICQLRSGVYFFQNEYEQCLSAGKKSLQCAHRTESPETLARALSGLGDAEYSRGGIESAHHYFDMCVELAREHGFGRVIAANLSMRGFMKIRLNDLEGAETDFNEAHNLALQTGHLRAEMIASHWGKYQAEMGDIEAGERLIQRGLDISRQLGSSLLEAANLYGLARILSFKGERDKATEIIWESIRLLQQSRSGMTFRGATAYGVLALATPDREERHKALADGEALLNAGSMGHNYFDFYEDAIEACVEASEWDKVDQFANRLEKFDSGNPSPRSKLLIARGRLLASAGRGEQRQGLSSDLQRIREQIKDNRLVYLLPALDKALAQMD